MTVTCHKILVTQFKYFSMLKDKVLWNVDPYSLVHRYLHFGGTRRLPGVTFRHKDHPFSVTVFRRDTMSSSDGFRHFSPFYRASSSSLYACLHFQPNQLRLQGFLLVPSVHPTVQSSHSWPATHPQLFHGCHWLICMLRDSQLHIWEPADHSCLN